MKRISIVIIVALLLLLKTDVFAQETTPPAKVEYTLPYPGVLPDHPLWFLKAVRDRIITFLVSDSLKKGAFNLSQADKRLGAGASLFKKGRGDLAVSTISKGENYLTLAVSQTKEAKSMGKDVRALSSLLVRASFKHQEVLRELIKSYPDFKSVLEVELRRVEEQEKLASNIIK